MIVITHDYGSIEIKGHAGYAPSGQDIVCAAVSALTESFLLSIKEMTADSIKHAVNAGYCLIEYKNLSYVAQVLTDSFLLGLKAIADSYPNNVQYVSKL